VNRFWERVMLALVVCVPVPALALSGLNVPLPSVVERVAAALVPFATAATIEDGTTLASGRIVQAPGQDARVGRSSATKPVASVRDVRRAAAPTPQSSSRARTKAGTLLPVSSGASSTFGEDSTAATPVSPAPSPAPREDTPAPAESAAPAPSANVDEKPKPRPTDPRPVAPEAKPDPGPVTDVDPSVEPDVKPPEPIDDVVAVPDVKPVVPPLPPIRERDENTLSPDADSGK
jgi:hypothetical protein